jgi:ATP-dependent DNA helicase RecG
MKGVNKATAGRLKKLGVTTVYDLLYLMPRRHNDYSRATRVADLKVGIEQTVVATVWEAHVVRPGGKEATEAFLGDETGNIRAIWFGRSYIARALQTNAKVVLSGRVDAFRGQKQFQSPEYEVLRDDEDLLHTGRLVPVYPLTEGLYPRTMRRLMWQALEEWAPSAQEFVPPQVMQRQRLVLLQQALRQVHFPDSQASWEEARRRLAFDELLVLQLAVLSRRARWREDGRGVSIPVDEAVLEEFRSSLPFHLTQAQSRVLRETLADMARGTPAMSRLVQGDVGSGKTVVALAAMLMSVAAGYQSAMMAPTEILAEQHFTTVEKLLMPFARPVNEPNVSVFHIGPHPQPISVGLLLGRMGRKEKEEVQRRVKEGEIDLLIGTHALIQEDVSFQRLGLAVVDEQHRFGVLQRAALRGQAEAKPHVLVMSATPIPRTLALTLYGDLDVSVLDELPPGRQRITTKWVQPDKRQAAYGFLRKQVQEGRQAFVICPLIEESEVIEARAATEEYQRLSTEVFPDLRLGLVHGRMSSKDKEEAMRRFHDRETDILVSTPVVEVGIDVPNATVMLIEAADRFGLAQLHQFRGRVGRGQHKSYCLLLSENPSEEAGQRLRIMEETQDGFKLAEEDLRMRGPGDFFGTRQSGLPALKVAGIGDRDLFLEARKEAERLLEKDPSLNRDEHHLLSQKVARFLDSVTEETS